MLDYEEHIKSLKPVKPTIFNESNILTIDPHTPFLFQPFSPSENQCYVDKTLNYIPVPKIPIKKYKKRDYKWNTKEEVFCEGSVDNKGNFIAKNVDNSYWCIKEEHDEGNAQDSKVCDTQVGDIKACNTQADKGMHSQGKTTIGVTLQEMEAGLIKNNHKNVFTADEMVLKMELGELKNKYIKRIFDSNFVKYEILEKELKNPFFSKDIDKYFERNTDDNSAMNVANSIKATKSAFVEEHKANTYKKKRNNVKEIESKFEMMEIRNKEILGKETVNEKGKEDDFKSTVKNKEPVKNFENAEPKFTKYKVKNNYKNVVEKKNENAAQKKSENATQKKNENTLEKCEKSIKFLEKYNRNLQSLVDKIKGKNKLNALKIIKNETNMEILDCEYFLTMFLKEIKVQILNDVDLEGFEIKKIGK